MKIHLLGSCCGAEPIPNRMHTAFILEHEDKLYWFDAGEGCSRTAHFMGLDIRRCEALFISHPHIDHVGGLMGVVWNICKILSRTPGYHHPGMDLYLPEMKLWDCFAPVCYEKGYDIYMDVRPHRIEDGVIFDDGKVKVEALHNFHLGEDGSNGFHSYSFRISAGGKKIIFSGDVHSYKDYAVWYREHCDLLLMETGHHKAAEVCAGLRADKAQIDDVIFIHSGREIHGDCDGVRKRASDAWGKPIRIGEDATTYEI